MLANIISQTIIDEVIGNSEDSLPNKIKEKEESLLNTLNNRLSIPVLKFETEAENDEYTDEATIEVQVEKNASSTTNEEKNSQDESNNSVFELTCFSDDKMFEGNEKPINVKEHMIVNMSKRYSELFVTQKQEVEQESDLEVTEDSEDVDISKLEKDDVESQAIQYGIPANIEQILVNTVDFDTTVVAINQTREKYKNVAEQANRAELDAEESDKLLAKISDEYTEAEKQLKEKELRSKAMEQKIISLLNTEQSRLTQQLQEKEDVINNANRRREENNGKIVDFKTKISSTLEKASEYDAMLSRQEELLNTLVGFNMGIENNDAQVHNAEKSTSKVA